MITPRKPLAKGTKIITTGMVNNLPLYSKISDAIGAIPMAGLYRKIRMVNNSPAQGPKSMKASRGCLNKRIASVKGTIIGCIAGKINVYWVRHDAEYWNTNLGEWCVGSIAPYLCSEFELDK